MNICKRCRERERHASQHYCGECQAALLGHAPRSVYHEIPIEITAQMILGERRRP
jgi:uncharacterized paraquat-inducible protein A